MIRGHKSSYADLLECQVSRPINVDISPLISSDEAKKRTWLSVDSQLLMRKNLTTCGRGDHEMLSKS